jgi:hypothetical protein
LVGAWHVTLKDQGSSRHQEALILENTRLENIWAIRPYSSLTATPAANAA